MCSSIRSTPRKDGGGGSDGPIIAKSRDALLFFFLPSFYISVRDVGVLIRPCSDPHVLPSSCGDADPEVSLGVEV